MFFSSIKDFISKKLFQIFFISIVDHSLKLKIISKYEI